MNPKELGVVTQQYEAWNADHDRPESVANSADVLLTPIDLGPFVLSSRIMSTGHAPRFSPHGVVSEQEIAFYGRKAAGGFPLITTGTTAVHPTGKAPGLY